MKQGTEWFDNVERPASRQRRPPNATRVFKGALFEVWQWKEKLFDGRTVMFEQLSRPDTVLVLPVLDDGRVVLAMERQPGMPLALRALGGRVESGESAAEAARRELIEESGYRAQELRLWDAWQPAAKIDWVVYLYVAHGLTAPTASATDGGEMIALRMVPAADLLSPAAGPVIDDYELVHKLYFARSDEKERERVWRLLTPR